MASFTTASDVAIQQSFESSSLCFSKDSFYAVRTLASNSGLLLLNLVSDLKAKLWHWYISNALQTRIRLGTSQQRLGRLFEGPEVVNERADQQRICWLCEPLYKSRNISVQLLLIAFKPVELKKFFCLKVGLDKAINDLKKPLLSIKNEIEVWKSCSCFKALCSLNLILSRLCKPQSTRKINWF